MFRQRNAIFVRRGSVSRQRAALHITHVPFLSGVAPGPAKAVIEQREWFSGPKFAEQLSTLGRSGPKRGRGAHHSLDRLGIMRSDDSGGERQVG